jgi:acyl carrier protein
MNEQQLENELRRVLAEACQADPVTLGLDDDLVCKCGLDSLGALRVLATVELRFHVRLPDARLAELRTARQLLAVITSQQPEEQG